MNNELEVGLAVTPLQVWRDTPLDIRGAVRNLGPSVVDTEVWRSLLLVNGEESEMWSWAIANGLRDERELALPPSEQVEFRRTLPSTSVLPGPGQYELTLEVRGIRSTPVTVEMSACTTPRPTTAE